MVAVRLVMALLLALLPAAEGRIPLKFGRRKPRPAAAAATPLEGEDPPPPFVSRGWLMKKGRRRRRNWKRRYFVLSDDWSSISYFEDEHCSKERGRVHLEGARCDAGLDYVPKKMAHAFAFTVRAGDDVYHLECSSEGERQRWLRTLRTAATSARDEAKLEVEEERRAARRAKEALEEEREAPASLRAASVDGLLGEAGLFHREGWLRALNDNLASERTLARMNEALRGIYVVEAMTLRYAGDDRIAVKRFELRPDKGKGKHCLGLDVRWPQRLTCDVKGHRPAGGGLPPFLRAAALHLKMDLSVKHPLSFQLRSRLCGRPRCELVLEPSASAPFPRLARVELTRLPRVALDRHALRLEPDETDVAQSLLRTLCGMVPEEVLVGLLERQLNDALEDPRTAEACRWDLPNPDAREETPLAGRLARAAEASWKGVAVEFPVTAAQVEKGAGWFGREVGRRAVAAWGAVQAAAPGPHSLLPAKEEGEGPRWPLRAEQEEETIPEWDVSEAVSIHDVEPLDDSDHAVPNTNGVLEKSDDDANAGTGDKGRQPSILDAGLLEELNDAMPDADVAPEKSTDTTNAAIDGEELAAES